MSEESVKQTDNGFIRKLATAAEQTAARLKESSPKKEGNKTANGSCAQAQNTEQAEKCAGLCLFESTIKAFFEELRSAVFPNVFCCVCPEKTLVSAAEKLYCMLLSATGEAGKAQEITLEFLAALPEIRRVLLTDVSAGYRGDPAAKNEREIALCYPCFYALVVHRTAHFLYGKNVPVLPRMMSEIAHSRTGIDIHPGAQIGEYFFIDHGTGVVIGETATIGRNVKLYQGVTIGAKSFKANADGSLVKGVKRHPDILNDVVIYANASVLGGNTVVGNGAVIGGNAWVTHSVPDGVTIPSNYVG